MFKPSKWSQWYDAQPEHVKQWMKTQPIWYDRDLFKACAFGVFVGILIGVAL